VEKDASRIGLKERRSARSLRLSLCAAALALLPFTIRTILAQSTAAAPQASQSFATPTLHVYENLKQVPVLVLSPRNERMKPLDTSKFRLSLDSGPLFRPTYVRQEGDDPISLAILIDATHPESDLLPQLSQAIAALVPDYLQPHDRVSIYAMDCTLIRTAFYIPANAEALRQSVDSALQPWQIRREQKKHPLPPCKPSMPLWDSMANVLDDLQHQSGRRVLLAITDGHDDGSRTLWTKVMRQAQLQTIAVFGLLTMPVIGTERSRDNGELFKITSPFILSPEDKFNQVCDLSGGVEIQARDAILSWRLKEFTRIVRERYILEFPRANNEEAGHHTMQVTYRKRNNFYIMSSGISVPVATEDEIKGAGTIPVDPSRAPAEGKRKVLSPTQ
jgi:hypothetical protein